MALIQKVKYYHWVFFWGFFFGSFIFGFQAHTLNNSTSNFFAKFSLQKYDFNLFKGFSMEKNDPKFARLWGKKIPSCQTLMISSSR